MPTQTKRSVVHRQRGLGRKRRKVSGIGDNNNNNNVHAETLLYDSHLPELVEFEARLERRFKDAMYARDRLVSTSEYYQQPLWKRESRPGDLMLNALFRSLAVFDQTKFRRSPSQMEMHVLMTQACLRQIYGTEYLSKLPELLQRFGVSSFLSLVAVFATRRFGKTFALAQFIAAFMWSQERSVINVFSLSRRASRSMVDKILMMLQVLVPEDTKLEIKAKNEEVLTIMNPLGICSTVYSYPCSEIRHLYIYLYLYLYVCCAVLCCAVLFVSKNVRIVYCMYV